MLNSLQASDHPEPTLQATALRYAADDLTPAEAVAFETRLGHDQDARDALSEAVRLCAAALGQPPPTPHRSFRVAIRERLRGWSPAWLARRAYRGHPLSWVALGAIAVTICTVIGLSLADRGAIQPTAPPAPVALAPAPRQAEPTTAAVAPAPREVESFVNVAAPTSNCGDSVAEIWAQLSTPEHVEKAHDEELRWRQRLRDVSVLHPGRLGHHPMASSVTDGREP